MGLFRSFAVVPALRRQGLGTALFERIDRAEAPAAIASTQQFQSLCPASAACFRRRLDAAAVHLPRDVLTLRSDVPGATMWAVALERAMPALGGLLAKLGSRVDAAHARRGTNIRKLIL